MKRSAIILHTDVGVETAAILKSGDQPSLLSDKKISSQVLGYLRWYGDLTEMRGCWPLADTINYMVHVNRLVRTALPEVLKVYAEKWNVTPQTIRKYMQSIVEQAIGSHPDFASQVFQNCTTISSPVQAFLSRSVLWLYFHDLMIFEDIAYWKFCPPRLEKEKEAYITKREYDIVCWFNTGLTFEEIADRLNSTPEHVMCIYGLALEKAESMFPPAQMPGGIRPSTMEECLESLGFFPWIKGTAEWKAALGLVQNDPSLLDSLSNGLYPAIAARLDETPREVSLRMYYLTGEVKCQEYQTARSSKYRQPYFLSDVIGDTSSHKKIIPKLLEFVKQILSESNP